MRHQVRLLDHKVKASPNQTCRDTPPQHAVNHVLIDAFTLSVPLDSPQADHNTHNIHQTIPTHGQRPKAKDYRIDIEVDVWRANTKPAQVNQVREGKDSH